MEPAYSGGIYPSPETNGTIKGKLRCAARNGLDLDIHYQADSAEDDLGASVSVVVDGMKHTATRDGVGGKPDFPYMLNEILGN